MTPELQKELAAWLSQMRDAMQHGTEFALNQAPLIVQDKILYGRIYETLTLFTLLVVLAAMVYCTRFCYKQKKKHPRSDWEIGVVASITGCICTSFFILLESSLVIQVWLTPRLYVLNWLADVIKN